MLDHGVKFDIPFDAKIVFSTNLQPETLGDEAFFRRIQSKVLIPSIADDAFDEVLRRVCDANGVRLTPGGPGAPASGQPGARRRRSAALPPGGGVQDPHLDLLLRGPPAGTSPPR